VIAAATCEPRTAEALHRFHDTRVQEWAPCVEQAAPGARHPRAPAPARSSARSPRPLYYRLLTTAGAPDEAAAHRAAAAPRAGGYVRTQARPARP
jgi:hypothetical protein